MKRCDFCGKKFSGRANQLYCGGTCKSAAYKSRKRQKGETQERALSSGMKKDLNLIREKSEDAYDKLMHMHAAYGRSCFEDAMEIAWSLLMDIASPEV